MILLLPLTAVRVGEIRVLARQSRENLVVQPGVHLLAGGDARIHIRGDRDGSASVDPVNGG